MGNKLIKRLPRLAKKGRSDSGFSMTDMLVATVITSVVVASGGVGVASMMDASTTANAKSERRVEMNRALDFITTEIRTADSINKDNLADPTVAISGFNPPDTGLTAQIVAGTVKKVLVIQVPTLTSPIVYYSAEPVAGKWTGPRVVYRWGPEFNSDGTYASTSSTTWKHEALIDKIDNSTTGLACADTAWTAYGTAGFFACVDPKNKLAQISQTGQIKKLLGRVETYGMSIQSGTRGTTVSVADARLNNGALTAFLPELKYISGTGATNPADSGSGTPIASSSGTPTSSSSDTPTSYTSGTPTVAVVTGSGTPTTTSSGTPTVAVVTGSGTPTGAATSQPSSSPTPVAPPPPPVSYTSSGGTIKFTEASNMTIRYLGGEITCGAGGSPIPTSGKINLKTTTTTTTTTKVKGKNVTTTTTSTVSAPGSQALGAVGVDVTISNVAVGTTLDISGTAGNGSACGKFSFGANSVTDQGTQVLTLVDGDTVPLFTPYGGQRPIDSFLGSTSTNPLTGLPIINATTGKVALAKNQVIYLFELGTSTKTSAAYDMQDMVVLATITPTTTTAQAYANSSSSNGKCNNGVGNGSDGCTPGNSTSKDEKLYNISTGALTCTPATGNPCKQNSTNVPSYLLPAGVTPKG